jgi:hypothetical protein
VIRGIGLEPRPLKGPLSFPLRVVVARKSLVLAAAALAALALASSAASASAQEFAFTATAWGTQVRVGSTAKSGRSAFVVIGCISATGVKRSNTTATVKVPKALSTGTIDTSAASEATRAGIAATSSATTQHVNLLGGMVTATAIRSVSTTRHNSSSGKFSTSAAGTRFVHLVIGGHAIGGTPKRNTKITLPGIGYVVLNQQKSNTSSASAGMRVIGIHLVVTATSSHAKAGTQAFVSVANSSLHGPVSGLLHGVAFGTSANVGHTVITGKSYPQYMPCLGTDGATRNNTGVGVTIPGVIGSGTITDTANGIDTSARDFGKMTSTVQGVNLLAGAVSATVVKADVTANGNPPTLRDKSSFIGLHVAGHPEINGDVPANTKVNLPGIGTLWLHRVVKTSREIKVTMIQLVITSHSNPAGLPLGATINVGYARVGVK